MGGTHDWVLLQTRPPVLIQAYYRLVQHLTYAAVQSPALLPGPIETTTAKISQACGLFSPPINPETRYNLLFRNPANAQYQEPYHRRCVILELDDCHKREAIWKCCYQKGDPSLLPQPGNRRACTTTLFEASNHSTPVFTAAKCKSLKSREKWLTSILLHMHVCIFLGSHGSKLQSFPMRFSSPVLTDRAVAEPGKSMQDSKPAYMGGIQSPTLPRGWGTWGRALAASKHVSASLH